MATKVKTAKSAYAAVARSAEKIRNAEPAAIATMSAGDVVRQGDLYVTCLDASPRRAAEYPGRQLAPGGTQGSRHTAEGECLLYTPDGPSAAAILGRLIPQARGQSHFFGPVVESTAPWTLAHPEHGDRVMPAGVYQVTYQRAWADEVRRQMD